MTSRQLPSRLSDLSKILCRPSPFGINFISPNLLYRIRTTYLFIYCRK